MSITRTRLGCCHDLHALWPALRAVQDGPTLALVVSIVLSVDVVTPEEAVAHRAQEQFDEYEREIAALWAALAECTQALARIAAPPTDRDGIGVTARAIATAVLATLFEPDSVTHNPKPDWTVTHQRSTSCPWCSEPPAEGLREAIETEWYNGNIDADAFERLDKIAAEPPAEGLDAERLGIALGRVRRDDPRYGSKANAVADAEAIAREYAAIAPEQPE